jgi:hypothetical protein
MAIDGPAGKVVQVFETPADALNAVNLSEIISAFADTARTWREIVQRSSQTATPERGGYPGIKV